MEIYKNFSDSFSDEGLEESSDETVETGKEEGKEEGEEKGEEGEEESEEEREEEGEEEGEEESEEEGETDEDSEDEKSNDLDEIIEKLKKQINLDIHLKEKIVPDENILIEFNNDNNLEKIQNEYINKIKNLNKNVIVTFKISEKLINTRVFTFYKCWRNGYCLNSSITKIPSNIIKVLFTKN